MLETAARTSLGVKAALALLKGYKLLFSPYFAGSCRFVPSCADYARDAVILHGVIRGSWLALKRLTRCHPFCVGGHDPLPDPRRADRPPSLLWPFRLRAKRWGGPPQPWRRLVGESRRSSLYIAASVGGEVHTTTITTTTAQGRPTTTDRCSAGL